MLERIVPHDEGRERLNEIARSLVNDTIRIPTAEEFQNGFTNTRNEKTNTSSSDSLADKFPPFTEDKMKEMNRKFPDTF
jgi:hypothetical protein